MNEERDLVGCSSPKALEGRSLSKAVGEENRDGEGGISLRPENQNSRTSGRRVATP